MKTARRKALMCAACLVLTGSAFGQIYSSNIAGYFNLILQPGVNLIADQFLQAPDNSLDTILNAASSQGGLANNTSFTLWNNGGFLPLSYYNASSDSWSINYQLGLGSGGYLTSPTLVTNVFFGSVGPYFNEGGNNVGWNPNYPNGMQLISNPIPIAGNLSYEFYNVTGRNPVAGEGVATWDPLAQTYTESFFDGSQWLNQNLTGPSMANIQVGQAAWFALGADYFMTLPSSVPEPSTLGLIGLGAGLLFLRRKHMRTS